MSKQSRNTVAHVIFLSFYNAGYKTSYEIGSKAIKITVWLNHSKALVVVCGRTGWLKVYHFKNGNHSEPSTFKSIDTFLNQYKWCF